MRQKDAGNLVQMAGTLMLALTNSEISPLHEDKTRMVPNTPHCPTLLSAPSPFPDLNTTNLVFFLGKIFGNSLKFIEKLQVQYKEHFSSLNH